MTFPKFRLEQSFSLGDTLKQMGMTDMFAPGKANFTGFTDAEELYVSAVLHKAFLEVSTQFFVNLACILIWA